MNIILWLLQFLLALAFLRTWLAPSLSATGYGGSS